MRIGGVGRDAKAVEGVNSLETIKALGHKNDIRMQGREHFQTRVHSAADFGFFLRARGMGALVVAKSAALCGVGGGPGLRLFSRLQWRDRGRFTRPSPLPLPAN